MILNIIGPNEINLLIDLALSLFSGFVIGAERESRGKAAGISTNTLVITGAMAYTFISGVVDPASQSRIAAQIVSGIGFLGAGLILKEGTNVKNLTTAASIWAAGSVGMAYGFNYHTFGLIMTAAIVLIPRIPHLNKRSPESLSDSKD